MKMIQDEGRVAAVPSKAGERIRIGIGLSDFANCVDLFVSIIGPDGAHRWTTMQQFDGHASPHDVGEKLRRLADAIENCPATKGEKP